MAIHAFLCFPETAGKPLEEIEEIFYFNTPAWKTRAEFASGRRMEKGELNGEKHTQLGTVEKREGATPGR